MKKKRCAAATYVIINDDRTPVLPQVTKIHEALFGKG